MGEVSQHRNSFRALYIGVGGNPYLEMTFKHLHLGPSLSIALSQSPKTDKIEAQAAPFHMSWILDAAYKSGSADIVAAPSEQHSRSTYVPV